MLGTALKTGFWKIKDWGGSEQAVFFLFPRPLATLTV
jgi:hypothetical protein